MDLASRTTALITSTKEMQYIMKIVKSLEKSGIIIKGIGETTENKARNKKADFFQWDY